jgi:hypothetical protein
VSRCPRRSRNWDARDKRRWSGTRVDEAMLQLDELFPPQSRRPGRLVGATVEATFLADTAQNPGETTPGDGIGPLAFRHRARDLSTPWQAPPTRHENTAIGGSALDAVTSRARPIPPAQTRLPRCQERAAQTGLLALCLAQHSVRRCQPSFIHYQICSRSGSDAGADAGGSRLHAFVRLYVATHT